MAVVRVLERAKDLVRHLTAQTASSEIRHRRKIGRGAAACFAQIGRTVRNWTGTDGILEIYAGDKLVKRFMKIDELTTATGTKVGESRPYRFGYGVLDSDLDGQPDPGGKQIYFEISDYSTPYVFY